MNTKSQERIASWLTFPGASPAHTLPAPESASWVSSSGGPQLPAALHRRTRRASPGKKALVLFKEKDECPGI